MSELETAQELAETAVRQVNVFALQGDKVDFLINQLKQIASLPQLTIPKSIADLLDKFIEFYFDDVGHEDWWIQENGLIEWFSKTPNCYIKDAYLSGKALGVDLVKVVKGINDNY
ncbi:hypothetical protein [Lactococcus lactis]|uniref:hypothetical protein n=1 Tax=Lactococcus lactis TaxID=1358 RepID=UPI00223B8CF2|nr:hypothetical protein [Lactococcus lactis]MCT0028316.1 hypothetical protein [Lactococcus lactis subsp. lactis]MCT3105661.1 hypothetical protein [Lactococcus lactis]